MKIEHNHDEWKPVEGSDYVIEEVREPETCPRCAYEMGYAVGQRRLATATARFLDAWPDEGQW